MRNTIIGTNLCEGVKTTIFDGEKAKLKRIVGRYLKKYNEEVEKERTKIKNRNDRTFISDSSFSHL